AERRVINTETAMLSLNPGETFAGAALDVDVPGRGTLIVTLQVRAMYGKDASRNRKYLAADIIAVKEPGATEVFQQPPSTFHQRLSLLTSPQQTAAQNQLADSGKLRPDKTAVQRE